MLPPDTVLNGRYRLLEPIGEGGMATVYRAIDTRLGRPVAVKLLHPEYTRDTAFVQRFTQEAEFAASFGSHPNIVSIYDVGEDGNLHYMVMELIEGKNLKDMIRERAPFSVREAFDIGRQVASALDFAHRRGLVHRDVKPQNIMVTPEGTAKVTDFGIARSLSASQITRTGMVIGTVHYFSPEQAQGQPVTPSSDIYSLGIILYEMLTAHLPFDAETPIGVAWQHAHNDPPPPWQFNQNLPARAVAVVMRALEKDPGRRYRDAGEFAGALGGQAVPESGGTTMIAPVADDTMERTTMVRRVEPEPEPAPPPQPRPVAHRTPVRTPTPIDTEPPPNGWRTAWLAVGAIVLVGAIALAAFFVTQGMTSGSASTPTPTRTPKPSATPKKKPTRTPTKVPTTAPVVFPTFTPTSLPLPTFTPVPVPTNTPKPKPKPTATPIPPTDTPIPDTPTPEPAPGPTETPTAAG